MDITTAMVRAATLTAIQMGTGVSEDEARQAYEIIGPIEKHRLHEQTLAILLAAERERQRQLDAHEAMQFVHEDIDANETAHKFAKAVFDFESRYYVAYRSDFDKVEIHVHPATWRALKVMLVPPPGEPHYFDVPFERFCGAKIVKDATIPQGQCAVRAEVKTW